MWIFSVCAPSLVGAHFLHPTDASVIFLHNGLLCNGTWFVTGGGHNVHGGGHKQKRLLKASSKATPYH